MASELIPNSPVEGALIASDNDRVLALATPSDPNAAHTLTHWPGLRLRCTHDDRIIAEGPNAELYININGLTNTSIGFLRNLDEIDVVVLRHIEELVIFDSTPVFCDDTPTRGRPALDPADIVPPDRSC